MQNSSKSLKFSYAAYSSSDDKCQYIHELLLLHFHRLKLDTTNAPYLCMNQLISILNQADISNSMKIRQYHQVYLFGTYQRFQHKNQTKKKLQAIMNQEKKKLDIKSVARWFEDNIQKGAIKVNTAQPNSRNRASSMHPNTSNNHRATSYSQINGTNKVNNGNIKNKIDMKLPPIHGTASQKLTEELKFLVQIFEEMEKQRQNSGLIPINLQAEDQEMDLSSANIPYDPELYILNNNLSKLRIKAEDRLARIIQLARDQPRIRHKLEEAIEKFQKIRIEANEKVGRMGAMKAQKRLIQQKQKKQAKFRNLKLGEEEDLLRAAKLYSLVVGVQERKNNKPVY